MSDSQKFVSRNRAPRVQIEYDVELYGAEKKVQLPFVMGVVSDLSGKAEKPSVDNRKFLEIDADNFDERMQGIAPQAQFTVPNTLTGEGSLSIDLTFEKMSDFSPEAIAERVETLSPLLEARKQLSTLLAYMDGKSGAEALIEQVLASPELLGALAGGQENATDMDAALADLKKNLPDPPQQTETTDQTLSNLANAAPEEQDPETSIDDVLGTIDAALDDPETDAHATALDALRDAPPPTSPEEDKTDEVLASVESVVAPDPKAPDVDAVLSAVESAAETSTDDTETLDDILSDLDPVEIAAADQDTTDEILSSLEPAQPPAADETDVADVLSTIDAAPENAANDELDDVLASLDAPVEERPEEDDTDDILSGVEAPVVTESDADHSATDILASLEPAEVAEPDDAPIENVLSTLDSSPEPAEPERDVLEDILGDIDPAAEEELQETADDILASLEPSEITTPDDTSIEDILVDLDTPEDAPAENESAEDILASLEPSDLPGTDSTDLDDILNTVEATGDAPQEEPDALDDLLADLGGEGSEETVPDEPEAEADLDDLLADLGAEDDVNFGQDDDTETDSSPEESSEDDDLDALLAGLETDDTDPAVTETTDQDDTIDDLNALLGDLEADATDEEEAQDSDDLDSILGSLDDEVDAGQVQDDALDDLLGDLDAIPSDNNAVDEAPQQSPFGRISTARPNRQDLDRNRFRMAVFGDFTGRAARGLREVGADLAARPPIPLDVDTVEEVIEGFATTLTLPIGSDGTGIKVDLREMDDLHPDELYEKVELFAALAGLRQQLSVGSMAEKAAEQLKNWSVQYATPVRLPKKSASTSIPANLKLSDFQALIGDTSGTLTPATPADELIARIVGPHVVKAPDAGAAEMQETVDEALSAAMRMILHHPHFQAIEAQWRSLDLLARRIETDSTLEIVLYDVSAEELAIDLAAQEDLSESGFFKLLSDVLDPEEGAGGFSALFGLYTFEETPPHAELLARISKVTAHVDAPFFAAMTPAYLETPKEDRPALVADAWDALRALPEAAYVGLASPRFMLRRPYGAKSEPIYAFEFEEFSTKEGLSGMLWANPVVLVAILLAGTFKKDGKAMDLGSLMSLGDVPFHYVTDRYGDQVALPCTERNLTSDPAQQTLARGYMPVLSIKGRDEIRLGSFRSLAGDGIAGPWSDAVPEPKPAPRDPDLSVEMEIGVSDDDNSPDGPFEPAAEENDEPSLDDLLAAFDDDDEDTSEDEMDPELAAMLEGL